METKLDGNKADVGPRLARDCNGFVKVTRGRVTQLIWLRHPLQTRPDLVCGLLARRTPGAEVVALDQYSRREVLRDQVLGKKARGQFVNRTVERVTA
jgi:hypothetical protein